MSDRDIRNDCLGRRYFEAAGELVEFTPGTDKRTGEWAAFDVIRPWQETGMTDTGVKKGFGLSCYREHCVVLYNDGQGIKDKRFLLRMIGGHLYFDAKNHAHLMPGQVVEVGLKPNPNPTGVWKAVHIRHLADSEEEYYAMSTEERRARPSPNSVAGNPDHDDQEYIVRRRERKVA